MKKLIIALSLAALVGCASKGDVAPQQNNTRWTLYDLLPTACVVDRRGNLTANCKLPETQLQLPNPVEVVDKVTDKVGDVVDEVLKPKWVYEKKNEVWNKKRTKCKILDENGE